MEVRLAMSAALGYHPIACFEIRLEMHLLRLQTKSADTIVIHAVQAESHVLPLL